MIKLTQEEIMKDWKGKVSEPLLSISCITYNHASYIEQCLDGMLMQETSFPFEILIHDDCSTDGTTEIIKKYEKKFPIIIKPLYEVENQYQKGMKIGSEVWNIPRAKGKYIALCEGDDYWIDNKKLTLQIDFLENNPEYGMCYTNFNIYHQKKKKFIYNLFNSNMNAYKPSYYSVEDWICNQGYVAPMTWVYRKDILLDYDSLNSTDDTYVMFTHFLSTSKVKCFQEKTTAVYRQLEESASHSRDFNKIYKRTINLYETQLQLINKYLTDNKIIEKCNKQYCNFNWKIFIIVHDVDSINMCLKYISSPIIKIALILGKNKSFSKFFKILYIFLRTCKNLIY